MHHKSIEITPTVRVGGDSPLMLISGPCQIESRDHAMMMAERLTKLCAGRRMSFIFKSSYDKANRTSLDGKRGIGIDEGLKILQEIRRTFNVPVITDIHTAEQTRTAAEVVDILQIPAFLCRQTDLLIAAGETGKAVHVKKGQFLHPADMHHVAKKIASTGNEKILLCERGTCFGYRDLMVDMRGLVIMGDTGYPVVFDATHSVQQMGGDGGGASGGLRQFIPPLLRAALATGVAGVFIECHENPDTAPSDGPCMLPLERMERTLDMIVAFDELSREWR